MCNIVIVIIILALLAVFGRQQLRLGPTAGDFGFCGDADLESLCDEEGGACTSSPGGRTSCCSLNPIISSQRSVIESNPGCRHASDCGSCLCIPNIGSLYVGASIATTRDTVPYQHPLGLPTSLLSNVPELTITPSDMTPGLNWHFVGGNGTIVIKLFQPAQISGVTVIHPSKCQIPEGFEKSAPKDFQLLGLKKVDDEAPFLFGNFTYDVYNGYSMQSFAVQSCSADKFQLVEFKFLTNHGNLNYTAIYKIRIHGDMTSIEEPKPEVNNNDDDEDD